MLQAASPSMARSQTLPLVVRPLKRLPPLSLLPGQTPAHDARCLAEGKRPCRSPRPEPWQPRRDAVAQQGGIIGHGVALLVCTTRRLHRTGTSLEVPSSLSADLGGMRLLATPS